MKVLASLPARRAVLLCCWSIFLLVSPRPARGDGPVRGDEWRVPAVQRAALRLARQAITQFLQNGRVIKTPVHLPRDLRKRGGVFVTVEKIGQIMPRGCRGTLQAGRANLAEEIIHNAIGAASRDRRVPKLRREELPQCRISLTIVLQTRPIQSIQQHDAAHNGLIAQRGSRIGIVLPFEGRDGATQLLWAKRKAGLTDDSPAQLLELVAVRFRE